MTQENQSPVILLADDNADDVLFFHRALIKTELPYPLLLVWDGEETIQYLAGKEKFADREKYPLPAFLFLDINMPKKNGWEVLEWMQEQELLEKIPVAMVSTSEHYRDLERAKEFPLKAYLVKPVRVEQLVKLLSA